MAYSTQDNVRIKVGGSDNLNELADLENAYPGDGGAGIAEVVADAILEADGIINSYLKQRYAVPLAIIPSEIAAMSASWAARCLRRYKNKGQPMVDDQEAEKIDRAWLKMVSDGEIQLGVDPTPPHSSLIVDTVGVRSSSLTVSNERLKGFI